MYSKKSIHLWLLYLTYTSPLIFSQLQPCRWAEAADLPLNFLTAVLTVSERACPGICTNKKHSFKRLNPFCCFMKHDFTYLHRSHQAWVCNRWDSSTCNFHGCSCSGAHRDEVSGHTRSDLEGRFNSSFNTKKHTGFISLKHTQRLYVPKQPLRNEIFFFLSVFSRPSSPTHLDCTSFRCIQGNTCICWGQHTPRSCSRGHIELVKHSEWGKYHHKCQWFVKDGLLSNRMVLLCRKGFWTQEIFLSSVWVVGKCL